MKVDVLLEKENLFEEEEMIALAGANASEYVEEMLEDVAAFKELISEYVLDDVAVDELNKIIDEMYEELESDNPEEVFEAVQRQFRRYGDKFLRQYRCKTGPKSGRLVSSPEACGRRKDPKKVRQGKAAARRKKGQRVRKTLFTKRKTASKRLSRMNRVLRGDQVTSTKSKSGSATA